MMSSPPPTMWPYARHILICTGTYCDPDGQSAALYAHLPQLLGPLCNRDNPLRVKRGRTPCLGVCTSGPVLVVYPEGIWYHHVTLPLLERIVHDHLRHGQPLWEHVFHSLTSEQP